MRWVILLLVFANVALFLWLSGRSGQSAPSAYLPQTAVNAQSMALVSERPASPLLDCWRVGPFGQERNVLQARELFASLNINARLHTQAARPVQSYRVFLGPFASESAANEARVRAREKNLEEFPKRYEDGSSIVSLGLFSQRDAAQRFMNSAGAILDGVSLKNELIQLPPASWFEVNSETSPDIESSLDAIEWAETETAVRQVRCTQ